MTMLFATGLASSSQRLWQPEPNVCNWQLKIFITPHSQTEKTLTRKKREVTQNCKHIYTSTYGLTEATNLLDVYRPSTGTILSYPNMDRRTNIYTYIVGQVRQNERVMLAAALTSLSLESFLRHALEQTAKTNGQKTTRPNADRLDKQNILTDVALHSTGNSCQTRRREASSQFKLLHKASKGPTAVYLTHEREYKESKYNICIVNIKILKIKNLYDVRSIASHCKVWYKIIYKVEYKVAMQLIPCVRFSKTIPSYVSQSCSKIRGPRKRIRTILRSGLNRVQGIRYKPFTKPFLSGELNKQITTKRIWYILRNLRVAQDHRSNSNENRYFSIDLLSRNNETLYITHKILLWESRGKLRKLWGNYATKWVANDRKCTWGINYNRSKVTQVVATWTNKSFQNKTRNRQQQQITTHSSAAMKKLVNTMEVQSAVSHIPGYSISHAEQIALNKFIMEQELSAGNTVTQPNTDTNNYIYDPINDTMVRKVVEQTPYSQQAGDVGEGKQTTNTTTGKARIRKMVTLTTIKLSLLVGSTKCRLMLSVVSLHQFHDAVEWRDELYEWPSSSRSAVNNNDV